ncbi:hypothetical protein QWZ16_02120 [Vibrio ostreicida]|uniref:Oxidoreductase FAD/NAD(P)-binding domain-containing protein n=1 Tax=Vibrio ostreicida TaxID=526588 RepID=A0ABT8BR37_9VIBR|nr:hypothetical protein [Vibrio ostreicida]MDN3608575.1 hypothetical protein [Vibrio ostreicida]
MRDAPDWCDVRSKYGLMDNEAEEKSLFVTGSLGLAPLFDLL